MGPIKVILTFVMLWSIGLCVLPSGRNWYYDPTANAIHSADFYWETLSTIPLQAGNGDIVALYPANSLKFVYYMTTTQINRVNFGGNNTQTLIRLPQGSQFGKQFIVDTKGNALWYQMDGKTYRCLLNGAGCKVATDVTYTEGLALDPLGNGVVYIASVQNSGPIIKLYKLETQSNGVIVTTQLGINWGCCFGVLSNVFISFASDGALWGSVCVLSGGPKYQIYRNSDVVAYTQVPFHPPFFVAPKNPNTLFFNGNQKSISQFVLGNTAPTNTRGGFAMFLEPSECDMDCSLKGFCYQDSCSCFQEYFGSVCSIYCNDRITCSGHGYCDFSGTCNCNPNWSGPSCSSNELTPPIFPAAFSVTGISFKNTQFNFYYDWNAQKRKYVYRTGLNVTDLFDLGKEYTQYPGGSCEATPLEEPMLPRWEVDQHATLSGFNIKCAQTHTCSLWKTFNTEWLVTSENIPVRINTTDGVYLYDPARFVLGAPPQEVWDVNC